MRWENKGGFELTFGSSVLGIKKCAVAKAQTGKKRKEY